MKKRIFISAAFAKDRKDGINEYLKSIFANYDFAADKDYEYYVLVNKRRPDQLFESVPGLNKLLVSGVNDNPIGSMLWHHFIMPFLLFRNKAAIIWIPTYRRIPLFSPCPVVATIHDVAFGMVKNKYDIIRTIFHKAITPIFIKKAACLITISESTKAGLLKNIRYQNQSISVVHSGINKYRYNLEVAKDFEALKQNIDVKRPYILYVGRLEHPGKNHVSLLKAYKRLLEEGETRYDLLFVGNRDRNSDIIFNLINELGLKDRVVYLEKMDDAILAQIYRNAELFVFPSLYEGFGFPVLEAMASGIPVVAANTSAIPEIAGNAAVLVDPYDINAMLTSIKLFLYDERKRQDYIERGIERSSSYDWQRTCVETFAIIKKAVKS